MDIYNRTIFFLKNNLIPVYLLSRKIYWLYQSTVIKYYKFRGLKIVHFLHIGRTGGKSIKFALRNELKTKNQIIILHSHSFRFCDVEPGEKVFFCVRDPLERFVSGFYGRKEKLKSNKFKDFTKDEITSLNYFDSPDVLARNLFTERKNISRLVKTAMKSIEHVSSSYYDWFISNQYLTNRLTDILFVCRQRFLNEDFKILKNKLQLPPNVSLPDKNRFSSTNSSIEIELSKSSIKNLKKWYNKEYAFLEILIRKSIIDNY